MAKRNVVQLKPTRTENEWKAFEEKIKRDNPKVTIRSYLRKKIITLIRDFNECPECITEMVSQKRVWSSTYISTDEHEALKIISQKTNTPINTIIDRGIIQPVLIEKI